MEYSRILNTAKRQSAQHFPEDVRRVWRVIPGEGVADLRDWSLSTTDQSQSSAPLPFPGKHTPILGAPRLHLS
ncbi:hypothetical protein Y032_0011g1237 [Ancylostoma ceylanicum]|uniref:Uncharacterized protein n=1 Tax=Ancylostoma ceylanicum TaxID=53326 RepID=A0A016VCW6_9BILA|nr:hypothetical protein Y032_0011g1237 [Ancylostoma ceylanicum]